MATAKSLTAVAPLRKPQRFVCIHGHFYQPPREHPWLEVIEQQESAEPYHDWNERIAAECYAPNGRSRILDGSGQIVRIVNNYAQISFNFGPTLLSWMETHAPDTYTAILEADRHSQTRFAGHGSAIAQVYNHVIMPLANARDRRTQVRWGIADFRRRFGRMPEGMWLGETAVDTPTLEVLAEEGIRFTILSPFQAEAVRDLGDAKWSPVEPGKIDTTQPYRALLPSGLTIDLFFYDAPISQGIAFEGLLKSGERFAQRLIGAFPTPDDGQPRLVHIATDGETYGHHSHHGDMALAYALELIQSQGSAEICNYGSYLERFPPAREVRIRERSAWSCFHGVGRWSDDCGCKMNLAWHQRWRKPLREALDALRDALATQYEMHASKLLRDPWAARDAYIAVINDRSPASVDAFLVEHASMPLAPAGESTALQWLELQRNTLLMFTSCGWFFDEISGLEPVQILAYASRALQLAEDLTGISYEESFLAHLALAPSNLPQHESGRAIYERLVKPQRVDLFKVGAHFGVSSLFESYPEHSQQFCYTAEVEERQRVEAGRARLVLGRARFTSTITRETLRLAFGAVYIGDLNLRGGVCITEDLLEEEEIRGQIAWTFQQFDMPEVIHLLDRHYAAARYSLRSLFRDEQRAVVQQLLQSTARDLEDRTRQMFEQHAPTMLVLQGLNTPLLPTFRNAAQWTLNRDLRQAFEAEHPDLARVRELLDEVQLWQVALDAAPLAYRISQKVGALFQQLREQLDDRARMAYLNAMLDLIAGLPFEVDLWRAQNTYYEWLHTLYPSRASLATAGDAAMADWREAFLQLGWKLRFNLAALEPRAAKPQLA